MKSIRSILACLLIASGISVFSVSPANADYAHRFDQDVESNFSASGFYVESDGSVIFQDENVELPLPLVEQMKPGVSPEVRIALACPRDITKAVMDLMKRILEILSDPNLPPNERLARACELYVNFLWDLADTKGVNENCAQAILDYFSKHGVTSSCSSSTTSTSN